MGRKLFVAGALLMLVIGMIQPVFAKAGVVHVVFSEANKAKYTLAAAERIEAQLKTGGFNVDRIGDADVASLNGITPDDVIVLSGIYVIGEDGIAALTRFAQQGGGVLWIDAPVATVQNSAALRKLLGCSTFTVSDWSANYAEIQTPRPILYKHFINGDHDFFDAVHCTGNSVWSLSTAYELGRFPPVPNQEWDVVNRSPVKGPGLIDRIPVETLNMVGNGRVLLFNFKATESGLAQMRDILRRATAWLLADGDEAAAMAILNGKTGGPKSAAPKRMATIEAVGSPVEEPLGNPQDFRLQMGIFARTGDYTPGKTPGMGASAPSMPNLPEPSEPMHDWPRFKQFVDNLKMIGAHSVYLAAGGSPVQGRDYLQEFCDAMHAEGLGVHTYSGEGGGGPRPAAASGATTTTRQRGRMRGAEAAAANAPRQRGRQDGTREGAAVTAGNARDITYRDRELTSATQAQATTSVLGANIRTRQIRDIWVFQDQWAQAIENLIKRDLDGMCVPPDEYSRPAFNGKPTDDSPAPKKFRELTGFDMPATLGDDPASRAWLKYGYDATAEVYAVWNNLVKEKKPNMQRTNIIFVGELCWNTRPPINWSIIGHASDWSAFMTDPYVGLHLDLLDHWYVPETVKRLAGSTPNHVAMVTLQNNRLREFMEQLRPLHVYGEAISSVAHGGKGVHFFHYFKIFDNDGNPYWGRVENTQMAFSMMRTLDKWGVMDAQVPQQVALLFNEMGQNYVSLVKDRYVGNGFDSQQAAIDLLLANGYPFNIYSLDHEGDWAALPESTRVVIVPFAYSISDKAVAQLESHAKAGRKIILMERMGDADENGTPRSTPALDNLLKTYPNVVTRVGGEIMTGYVTPDFEAGFCKTVDQALGDAKLVHLNRYGNDIEATALDLKDGRKILFAINWEKQPVRVELGINMPKGKYRVTERNLKGTQPAAIKGKDTVSARDLSKFAVNLGTEELKFWLVEPAS
ncbi:hypothetical protein LLG95_03765 [bacterium]|nr:hypothetical protein [bacterium]